MNRNDQSRHPSELMIPGLCLVAVLCPLRADMLQDGSVRLEFFWAEMHSVFSGISWQNAEMFFPLGALALLFIAFYFGIIVWRVRRASSSILWLCLIIHLLLRGLVDFYLVTQYFPLRPRCITPYWTYPGAGWRVLAFAGAVASITAVMLQGRLLWIRLRNEGSGFGPSRAI